MTRPISAGASFWLLALFVAVVVYLPGLSGGFVLDDHNNLGGLENIKNQPFHEAAPYYVLQGFAGPTGRPLSLLSFALQREHWPERPDAFKRVNLGIHLLNATLLLLLGIGLRRNCAGSVGGLPSWLPLLAAGMWLLLPTHCSTVFYVVQRMAMLAASCMILGLLLHVMAWRAWQRNRVHKAHALFATACVVGLGLGLLFKESAGVYPLLALSLHGLRDAGSSPVQYPRAWSVVLWGLAVSVLAGVLLVADLSTGYSFREFDLPQRLLTEPRVLWMYLGQIVTPHAAALPFNYDGLPFSRGLLVPPTTLAAVSGLLVVFGVALTRWRKSPLFAGPALFFLAAHALESSFLPLELAFEHRNYLASFGVSFGLAAGVAHGMRATRRPAMRALLITALGIYLGLLSWVGYSQSQLWGDDLKMAAHRFSQQSESRRARAAFADELRKAGGVRQSAAILDSAIDDFPEDAAFPVQRAELACDQAELRPRSLDRAESALRNGKQNLMSAFAVLDRLASTLEAGFCPAYSAADLLYLVDAAIANPLMRRHKASLLLIAGRLRAGVGDESGARQMLRQAIALRPRPTIIVQAAAWELMHDNRREARRYIEMLGPGGRLSWLDQLAVESDREKLQSWLQELEASGKD